MQVDLTLKNYRCFVAPATISLRKGFVAFVGVNNVGKSAFMRFLLEFRPFLLQLTDRVYLDRLLQGHASSANGCIHVLDQLEVFSNLNSNPIEVSFDFRPEPDDKLNYQHAQYTFAVTRAREVSIAATFDGVDLRDHKARATTPYLIVCAGLPSYDISSFFATASSLANTLYVGPFRNSINIGTREDYLDIKIGQSFIEQFRVWKTGPDKKSNNDISKLTNDIKKVFQFESLDISASAGNDSLHVIVNGRPYKQHELGSGLIHFVIALANAAFKTPSWILIDEPEINLHPTLQIDFLTTLAQYAAEGILFSTHSIGLARSTAERIYSIVRRRDGDSQMKPFESTPRLSEFLGEMSFSSHKELGFERVLLVEGPTDVKAIQQFLRLLRKDHQVVLLPLHGHMPKADELDELLRIAPRLAAIIDSEREVQGGQLRPDRELFIKLCESKGIPSHPLDRRAIENYFPDSIIKKVFGSNFRALRPYERLSAAQPHWSKSENWKLAAEINLHELESTDIGEFLKKL